MTSFVGLSPIEPQNSLITRLDEVTWQIKNRTSSYTTFSLFSYN